VCIKSVRYNLQVSHCAKRVTVDLQAMADICCVGMFRNYLRTTFRPFGSTCSTPTTMTYLASMLRRRRRSWHQVVSHRVSENKSDGSKQSYKDGECSHITESSSCRGGSC
jgi:hypothetical protein